MQWRPVPITIVEYMPEEWFIMVEEEDGEEVLYSYQMITVDIDFLELNDELVQDNHSRSNTSPRTVRPKTK